MINGKIKLVFNEKKWIILVVIRDILAILTILWGVKKIYILHEQKKAQDFFKKKINVFNNYIKNEFGTIDRERKKSYSEMLLIATNETLNAIIELKNYDENKSNNSFEQYQYNLVESLRRELSPGIKNNKQIIEDYIGILTNDSKEIDSKEVFNINNNKIFRLGELFNIFNGKKVVSTT